MWRHAAAITALFALSLLLGLLPPLRVGETRLLERGWQYRWTDATTLAPLDDAWDAPGWTPLTMPAHPPSTGDAVLWLRTRLPEADLRDPAIAIDAVLGPFEAYQGRERIHVHPAGEGLSARTPPGVPWQLISLPRPPPLPATAASASAGDRPPPPAFVLRLRSDGRSALLRGTPLHGERADHVVWVLRRDAIRLACGLFVVLIGLGGLLVFLRKRRELPGGERRSTDLRVLGGFTLWTVALGLYVVNYTHAKDLLLGPPRLWFGVWLVLLPAIPLGGLLFADGMFGSGPRGWLARLARLHAVLLPVVLVVHLACVWLYGPSPRLATSIFVVVTALLRVLLVVATLTAVVIVGRRAREGDAEARIFLLGFFVHFALASTDILASFGVAIFSWKSLVHYGVLALAIAQAIILERRYSAALERAAAYAAEVLVREREKESLLRDLHDGVGGLTSNIRVLAELGTKSDERAQRSLSTIAELSDKTLAQLRAFVQALDDSSTTWETLAADLRRFGTQLVTAAGIELEMVIELDAPEPPRGLLSIHVLRVFQESITNALKQRASRIAVTLRVDRGGAELVVTSEGKPSEGDAAPAVGLDLGRGLGNMRARAAEVGGTFTIRHGAPTTVRLYVPLPIRVALPTKPPDPAGDGALASREPR